jgi:Domain of unknown function DUF1828
MNCSDFESLIGMRCNPIADAVEIITPFTFKDGNGIEIYAQSHSSQVHFFDDGITLFRLHNAGIHLNDKRNLMPLKAIADVHGVTLSDDGVFELLCTKENASKGFANLVSAILGIADWERKQSGVSQDNSLFVEEVAMHLTAWKKDTPLLRKPTAKGFSGRTLEFDFQFGDQYIDAVLPHANSTGAELRKAVDLNNGPLGSKNGLMIIVEDRKSPTNAKQEIEILGRVATAWPMSQLIAASGGISLTTH